MATPGFLEPVIRYQGLWSSAGDSRSHVIIYIAATIVPFTVVVVLLRLYTRYSIVKSLGLDDCMISLSLILTIVKGVVLGLMTEAGLGEHRFYVAIIFYYAALGSIKIALLLQYRRIFTVKIQKIIEWALIVVGTWSVGLVLVSIFTCSPIQGYWDKSIKSSCIPNWQWYIHSVGNISSDILIFLLPVPVLWKLQMPLTHRLTLIFVFCFGLFGVAISIVRIQYLPAFSRATDDTFTNVEATGWSLGELCVGIFCACLPTLGPLVLRLRRKIIKKPKDPHFSSGFTASGALETGSHWQLSDKNDATWLGATRDGEKARIMPATSRGSVGRPVWRSSLNAIVERPDPVHHDEIELLESPRGDNTRLYTAQESPEWSPMRENMLISDALRELEYPPKVQIRDSTQPCCSRNQVYVFASSIGGRI